MPATDAMPTFVGALPEKKHGKRGPSDLTLNRARALQRRAGEWAEWPTSTAPAQLRVTLKAAHEVIKGGGSFECDTRNGKTYARFVAPALPAASSNGHTRVAKERENRGTRPASDQEVSPGPIATSRESAVTRGNPPAPKGRPKVGDTLPAPGAGGETITVYNDDGEILEHRDPVLAPFRPLGPSPQRDLVDAPVSTDAWRPKVKCPTCKRYLVIDDGETSESTMREHYTENRTCKTAQKRD